MTRISSPLTIITKRVIPLMILTLIAITLFELGKEFTNKNTVSPDAILQVVAFCLFGVLFLYTSVFPFVDEVWENGDELIVKNKGTEEHIKFSEIININCSDGICGARVTVRLRRSSTSEQEVSFYSKRKLLEFRGNSVVNNLIDKIDASRSH